MSYKMNNLIAYVCIGPSGSGKTSWSLNNFKQLRARIISRDDIRALPYFLPETKGSKAVLGKYGELLVSKFCNELIREAAINKENIIIADINLSDRFRDELTKDLKRLGYSITFVIFDQIHGLDIPKEVQDKQISQFNETMKRSYIGSFEDTVVFANDFYFIQR